MVLAMSFMGSVIKHHFLDGLGTTHQDWAVGSHQGDERHRGMSLLTVSHLYLLLMHCSGN